MTTLAVENLTVRFPTPRGPVHAVTDASWQVDPGQTVVLLGESGCGKTVSAKAVAGLLPENAHVHGRVLFEGKDLLTATAEERRQFRAEKLGVIFQNPMSALNPVLTIGSQLAEPFRVHRGLSRREALDRAAELLDLVAIKRPRDRLRSYPHELSGGMAQRVVIALAIALDPVLILADEPTTALDASVQAGILRILADLREKMNLAMVLVTHDMGVAAAVADQVVVMYAGRVVEKGPARQVLREPRHPYTSALLSSTPRLSNVHEELRPIPGTPPHLADIPPGCAFHPRCAFAIPLCRSERPPLRSVAGGSLVACHRTEELVQRQELTWIRNG